MSPTGRDGTAGAIPKKRRLHHSYDESVDEPATLIENEPVEVEAEVAAEENEPTERTAQDQAGSPAFEEE